MGIHSTDSVHLENSDTTPKSIALVQEMRQKLASKHC